MESVSARRISVLRRAVASGVVGALATVLFVVAVAAMWTTGAAAQEQPRRWFSLRDLFAPRHERAEPRRVRRPAADAPKARKTRQPSRRKAPAPAREPEVVVEEKAPDARVVLVIGDFLGGALADGLTQAYADNPNVRVVDRTRGSSGFVRDDFFDWPAEAAAIIEKESPAAIVVMLGSNDRQQLRVDGERHSPGSDPWKKEYQQRVSAFTASLTATQIPFVWTGLPSFKSNRMSDDMLVFNEFYRAAAASAGAQFVDIWDGFVDEKGAFTSTGPDIAGQQARLRSSDGINFTSAGKRKLAFYLEKPLAKILGLSPGGAPIAGPSLPDAGMDPRGPVPTDRTLPISLNDPELDGGAELLGALPGANGVKPATPSLTAGALSTTPTAGRADDFLWPTGAPEQSTASRAGENPPAAPAPILAGPSTP